MPAKDNRLTILTALVVVQIVAIAFLFARVVSMDESINAMAIAEVRPGEEETSAAPTGPRVADAGQAADALTAEQVRKIVREELRAQIGALASSAGAVGMDSTAAPDPYDEIEYQQQYELVDQELDFFINQGTISDTDMAVLQMEIAKLDPEGREEMLRRIVRALNSGELDGRL